MYESVLWTITGGLIGGYVYISISDFYSIYISKTQLTPTSLSLVNLVNEGMFHGAILGFIRWYTGKPLLSNFW